MPTFEPPDPYDALRVQHLFVEMRGSATETRERLARALDEVGGAGWALAPKPRVAPWAPSSIAWRVVPPDIDTERTLEVRPEEAWTLAHALARRIDGEVEPVFKGDVLAPMADTPREALEGVADQGPPPKVGWHLDALRVIGASGAHAIFAQRHPGRLPGEGVLIGHPDTGYTKHKEIWATQDGPIDPMHGNNYLEPGKGPLDPMKGGAGEQPGHGTSTSSVMVARPKVKVPSGVAGVPGNVDLLGIAPGARVAPYRVTKSVVILGWQSRLAAAIELAVESGCRVISMSLGGLGGNELDWAIETAEAKGVIVVAAAGNYFPFVVAPANHAKVVGCAATGPDDRAWAHSARGFAVKITAPGHLVWVAGWDGKKAIARLGSGTSFATAAVASSAALWLSYHGAAIKKADPTAAMFRAALKRAARRVDGLSRDQFGPGILDVAALLRIPLDDLRADVSMERVGPLEAIAPATGEPALSRMARHELEMHRLLDPELACDGAAAQLEGLTSTPTPPRASSGLSLELEKARLSRAPERSGGTQAPAPDVAHVKQGTATDARPPQHQAGGETSAATITLEIVLEIEISVSR